MRQDDDLTYSFVPGAAAPPTQKEPFIYLLPPIDAGWQNLQAAKDTLVAILEDGFGGGAGAAKSFLNALQCAKNSVIAAGWEGHPDSLPKVFCLPCACVFEYGFVFGADCHGHCFVVSPRELSWLSEHRRVVEKHTGGF